MAIEHRICRWCKRYAPSTELLKYGRRHYAHPECFLDAGHDLAELHEWQVGTIPSRVLKARGLTEYAATLVAKGCPS